MILELPKLGVGKMLLKPFWDTFITGLPLIMLAISIWGIGLQAAKDNLICTPAVNCSSFTRNKSALWNESASVINKLKICDESNHRMINGSKIAIVITTLGDRRQYDYVESMCFAKMPLCDAYFTIAFLFQALVLMFIGEFWLLICPGVQSTLVHFETLLLEFLSDGDLLSFAYGSNIDKELTPKVTDFVNRFVSFVKHHSESNSWIKWYYLSRTVFGIPTAIGFMIINFNQVGNSEFTKCRLETVAFLTEYDYFECSRPIAKVRGKMTFSIIYFQFFYIIFLLTSFFYVLCCKSHLPSVDIETYHGEDDKLIFSPFKADGGAGFLFQLLSGSRGTNKLCYDGLLRLSSKWCLENPQVENTDSANGNRHEDSTENTRRMRSTYNEIP